MITKDHQKPRAHIVGIASEGGEMRFVAPRRKPFIEINWEVLERLFLWALGAAVFFACGFIGGCISGAGG